MSSTLSKNEGVLITGGNGMIARTLGELLQARGYRVKWLCRIKKAPGHYLWDVRKGYIEADALSEIDHIVHLAGANIGDKRWSDEQKKEIYDSRIKTANFLFKTVNESNITLKSFITASGVGFYGHAGKEVIFDETSPSGEGFLARVCVDWEAAADQFLTINNTRVVKLRFGVVLARNAGALKAMTLPIRYFVGSPLGEGNQWIPWIHLTDLCNLIEKTIADHEMTGVYNAVAPDFVTNSTLISKTAEQLHRPVWLPNVPSFLIKLLLGERATLILEGNRVEPKRLNQLGFKFQWGTLEKALKNVL